MTNYEHLNITSRIVLEKFLKGADTSIMWPDNLPILLVANFLREISDSLARIDEKLGGIEMNGRPGA